MRKVLNTLMEKGLKIDYGEKIGKTIIFAKNHEHAEKILEIFSKEYPHLPGFAQVIDNYTNYAQSAIEANVYLGMNYRLSLEIDSSGPVRSRAATVGTMMRVQAIVEDVDEGLSPSPTWATPAAGTLQRRDYTLGEDADGDGLPDAWELWMMELNPRAGEAGEPDDLASFRPDADSDRDGMSNLQEFLAGTDPFSATDLFSIVSFEQVPGTTLAALTFKTSVDRLYHVLVSETPDGASWSPVATAETVDGAFGYTTYEGTGRTKTVYVDAALGSAFFKVACH